EVAVITAERHRGGEAIGVAKWNRRGADAAHRRARDRDSIVVDRVARRDAIDEAHRIVLAEIAVHRVAVPARRDDERLELLLRDERIEMALLPVALLLRVVAAEHVTEH